MVGGLLIGWPGVLALAPVAVVLAVVALMLAPRAMRSGSAPVR